MCSAGAGGLGVLPQEHFETYNAVDAISRHIGHYFTRCTLPKLYPAVSIISKIALFDRY